MPRPPRIKVKGPAPWPVPSGSEDILHDLPPEVQAEIKSKKDPYVQFRMPVDVWARLRARQFAMEKDAIDILQKKNLPVNPKNINIPMTEVMRKTFENPLFFQNQEDILGLVHKRGKGRIFR